MLTQQLHTKFKYTANSKTYATIDEQLRRLRRMPQAAYAADGPDDGQQPPAKHPDPNCYFCGQRETIGHYFGGCSFEDFHRVRLKRHGKSALHLVRAIESGSRGMSCLYHDSEAADTGERTARNLPSPIPWARGCTTPDVIFFL